MVKDEKLFSIGTQAEAVGVSTRTLRSCETCYGLLVPSRTAKGHRIYQNSDMHRLNITFQVTNMPLKQRAFSVKKINADGMVCVGCVSVQDLKAIQNCDTTIYAYKIFGGKVNELIHY
jgi:hypothetical protein